MWRKIGWGIAVGMGIASLGVAAEQHSDSTEVQLKSAVTEAQKKMTDLQPWQRVLYSEEVIPQFQRFIRDYRPTPQGLQVEVDFDSLKHYLSFYAPAFLKEKNPKILVYLESDPNCTKCNDSRPVMTRLIQARLERRGWTPVSVKAEDLSRTVQSLPLEEKVESLAQNQKIGSSLVVRWAPAPVEDLDTAHADEKRYILSSVLQVKDLSLPPKKKELLDTESFEASEARLLTDVFADLGAKMEIERIGDDGDPARGEVLIDLAGFQNYNHFIRVKTALLNLFKGSSLPEERKFSKGRVVFAVNSKKADEVRKLLEGANLDAGGEPGSTAVNYPPVSMVIK